MPDGAGPTEGTNADPTAEGASSSPHADIVERLLEYQRRLREESGGVTPPFEGGHGATPPATLDQDRVEPSARAEIRSEPETPAEQEPESRSDPEREPVAPEAGSEHPDARQLRDRIERLDETLARISAMLPLLRGGDDRETEP